MLVQTEEAKPFKRTAKQLEATKLQIAVKHALLVGGSRSGKTFITIRNMATRALKKTSRHLICRLRFNHVKTSIGLDTLPKVMKICFPELIQGVDWKLDKTDWYIEFKKNGSQIWLTGTDDGDRIDKILGTEYSTVYFNESSQFLDYAIISTLMTRLAENSGLSLKAYYDANPPTKKHWLYKVFFEGRLPSTNDPIRKWQEQYGHLLMNPEHNLENLPPDYIETLKALPKKQRDRFLKGLFGTDTEGALWNQGMIDMAHAKDLKGKLLRTVIGVDPAVSNNEDSDHWGIVVCELYENGEAKVVADYTIKTSTDKAADDVIAAYKVHKADAVVVEVNQGGDLVENVLRLKSFKGRVINVRAAKGKFARAEPVSALYEQDKVKHEAEGLEELETEMMEWIPFETKQSPNRIDALVWAMFELFKLAEKPMVSVYRADFRPYKHVSEQNLLPIKRLPVYVGWGLDNHNPAAIIMQKMNNGQFRVLDELVAEQAGLRRFALSKVRLLLKTKYKHNKFVSVGAPEGIEKLKSSDNERAAFDILWDCGIPTEASLDNGFEALTDVVRYSMQVNVMDQAGLLIDPRCTKLIEALKTDYCYDDNNKPSKIPLIEAHQYATMEIRKNEFEVQKPAIQHHVIIDEDMGY